jgi:hypothetical protein
MGLFSISSYLKRDHVTPSRLDIDSALKREPQCNDVCDVEYDSDDSGRSSHTYDNNKNRNDHRSEDNVIIPVGEAEPFRLYIGGLVAIEVLSRTEKSICIRLSYDNGSDDEVLVMKWATTKVEVNSRDHIAVLIACDVIDVPKYRMKEVFRHHNKFVAMGIRSYIHGQTLQSVYNSMTEDEIDAIFMQVQATMWDLAKKTSDYFGHINEGVFRTNTPIAHIRTRVFFDKALGVLSETDWVEHGADKYTSKATFCHGNLSPDHIIVDGSSVVGLVGWTQADFMSEIYERVSYYFRSDPNNPKCWFRKMSDVSTSPETSRPSVEFVINVSSYLYNFTWNRSDPERRRTVNQLWKSLTTNYTQVNCLALAKEIDCDNMSLSSLCSWANYSVSTVKQD